MEIIKNVTIKIDGNKPIELMTEKECDNYFFEHFGQTYQEFCDKADKIDMSPEAVSKRLDKIPTIN